MAKMKIRCAVEELNGKFVCYIHGAKSWKDFDPLVRILELGLKVRSGETVEGPDMRVFRFEFQGHLFSLVCDDAWGHEIQMNVPQNKAVLESLAERLQHIVGQHAQNEP
jgi:hypothetical protein